MQAFQHEFAPLVVRGSAHGDDAGGLLWNELGDLEVFEPPRRGEAVVPRDVEGCAHRAVLGPMTRLRSRPMS